MKLSLLMLLCLLLVGSAISAGLIDISSAPYTISQPGSYIVVADLTTMQNVNAITIETSNVTIDLNGHTLYGFSRFAGNPAYGIISLSDDNIIIKNGIARGFRNCGIYLGGKNCQVSNVQVIQNGTLGIYLYNYGSIKDCVAEDNGTGGINVEKSGGIITGNISNNNGASGIYAHDSAIVTGNSVSNNDNIGISAGFGCTVTDNNANNNVMSGIIVGGGSTVTGNSVHNNKEDGIKTGDGCTVIGNTCFGNTLSGISKKQYLQE
jgi:parallel beta-helix repeat protein